MFEPNRSCPRCQGSKAAVIAQVPAESFCGENSTYRSDWAAILQISAGARFPLCRCVICSFVFAGWQPPSEFLEKVYDDVIDAELGFRESTRFSWFAHQARLIAVVLDELETRWGLADRALRALDVGCSYGNQLQILRVAGLDILGIDSSQRVRAHLARVGVPAASSLEEARVGGSFELILLNEVLEHLSDFRSTLKGVREALAEKGIVWISVPDFSQWRLEDALGRLSRGEPATRELNLWEHLNYFTPRSLREILMEEGFKPCGPSYSIDLGVGRSPGWRSPVAALRVAKAALRWLVKGPPTRTQLLVEKA